MQSLNLTDSELINELDTLLSLFGDGYFLPGEKIIKTHRLHIPEQLYHVAKVLAGQKAQSAIEGRINIPLKYMDERKTSVWFVFYLGVRELVLKRIRNSTRSA